MASEHEPEGSRRDELLAVPGEDLAAWIRRARLKAVINPDALAAERTQQDEASKRISSRSRQRVRRAARWLIGSLLALAASVMLHQVAGLSWWLVVVSAVAVVAGIAAAARASSLKRSGATAAIMPGLTLGQNEIVRLAELDGSDRALLERARQAIDQVLSYPGYPGNSPDLVEREIELREQEWRLAVRLREATRLRARCGADPATTSSKSKHDLETAQRYVTAWVRELEELAMDSKAARIVDERYQGMNKLGQLNDEGLDLTAAMGTDAELAVKRIREFKKGLAERRIFLEGEIGEDG